MAEYDFDKPAQAHQIRRLLVRCESAKGKRRLPNPRHPGGSLTNPHDWEECPRQALQRREDKFNATTFEPSRPTAIRLEVKLKENSQAGSWSGEWN